MGVFLLYVHIGVFVCNLPVFCGPMTMNLGNLSQVFSLDQMSLCRLSSHGFYGGTDKIRDLYACCIMHTKTYMLIHPVGFRMNEWHYSYSSCILKLFPTQQHKYIGLNKGAAYVFKKKKHSKKSLKNRKTNLNSFRPSLSTTKFINNWEKVNTQVNSPSCPLFQAFEKKVSLLLVVKSELSLNHHSLYRTKENRTHFPHRTICFLPEYFKSTQWE